MPATLHYRCPNCDHVLEVDQAMVGQAITCPACAQPVRFDVEPAIPADPPADAGAALRVEREGSEGVGGGFEQDLDVVHPAMFRAHPVRWLVVALIALGGLGAGAWLWNVDEPVWAATAAAVAGGVALGYLVFWYVQTRFARLRLTNVRTIYRRGIVSRETTEVRHDDVRNMQIDQSVLQRLLGVGSIAISSAGQDGLEIVADDLPGPVDIVETIRAYQKPG